MKAKLKTSTDTKYFIEIWVKKKISPQYAKDMERWFYQYRMEKIMEN